MSQIIKNLISKGEHQKQDFKFEISDSRKIAKSLSAFSNTDGGRLLIGVKDNGAIAGVRSDEEFYMIEAAAQLYCKPEILFSTKQWKVDGKAVLEIIIPKNEEQKPILAKDIDGKWLPYIRVDDKNIVANQVLIKVWEKQKLPSGVFINYTENEKILLDYLNTSEYISLSEYCKIANISHRTAQNILANFIVLQIIDIEITTKQTYYRINKDCKLEEMKKLF